MAKNSKNTYGLDQEVSTKEINNLIMSESDYLYSEYLKGKNRFNDRFYHEYSDKYTEAWDRIREFSDGDIYIQNDWVDFFEYKSCH